MVVCGGYGPGVRMVAVGDSVSAAPGSWVGMVAAAFGAELTNLAVPGKEAHTVAEQQLPLLEGRFDVAALYVGSNDVRRGWDPSRYAAALGDCAKRLADVAGRLYMPTLPCSLYRLPRSGRVAGHVPEANRIIRATAADVGGIVVDLDDVRGRAYWSGDHIHPSPAGQAVIASRVLGVELPGEPTPLAAYLTGTAVAAALALVRRGPA